MAKILVIGSIDLGKPPDVALVEALGEEIIDKGHVLVGGCRNELDRCLAAAAFARLRGAPAEARIISYVNPGVEPVHQYGTVLRSEVADWNNLRLATLSTPETIERADAVVIVGGGEGTMCAANWARICRKLLFPITALGGAARDIYKSELEEFSKRDNRYGEQVDRREYEALNQLSSDPSKIAQTALKLAVGAMASKHVFVVMSFAQDNGLVDLYDSFRAVCEDEGYECHRSDDSGLKDRIIPDIFANIKKSAFVIVDLTEPKPNVYYELGYAQGLGKQVIATAMKVDKPLPFDVADIPIIYWENQRQVKEKLKARIREIAVSQGR